MKEQIKITAIIGSYRKGGIIDQTVDEILAAATARGGAASKIYLIDRHVEFCRNCRICTQEEGERRGRCPQEDEMDAILDEIDESEAIILASPMNFGAVTAVMKRFIERLICTAYWPWGQMAPKSRCREKKKRAVLVAASAAPAFLSRLMTPMVGRLKNAADVLGARTVGLLFVGLAARAQRQEIGAGVRKKARLLGRKLLIAD